MADKGEGEKQSSGGLLSSVGDPLGSTLKTGLSPLGKTVDTVTQPVTGAVGGTTKPILEPTLGKVLGNQPGGASEEKKDTEPIGGKKQSGDNPLGL